MAIKAVLLQDGLQAIIKYMSRRTRYLVTSKEQFLLPVILLSESHNYLLLGAGVVQAGDFFNSLLGA
jgi:hypothetical protein